MRNHQLLLNSVKGEPLMSDLNPVEITLTQMLNVYKPG